MIRELKDWRIRKDGEHLTVASSEKWYCQDSGDAILFIENDYSEFRLRCFTGAVASSEIQIMNFDYVSIWQLAFKGALDYSAYSKEEVVLILADWFCSLFCEKYESNEKSN